MLHIIILALLIATTQPKYEEYCLVTEIAYIDDTTDLVTVEKANGNESAFYADTHTYMAPQFVNVTFDMFGRIIYVK